MTAQLCGAAGAYWTTESEDEPATLFGFGSWEKVDRFLYGSLDEIGTEGGSETHTLSTTEMPAHSHTTPSATIELGAHGHTATVSVDGLPVHDSDTEHLHAWQEGDTAAGSKPVEGSDNGGTLPLSASAAVDSTDLGSVEVPAGTTGLTGGGSAFSILPPHRKVYHWRRTA